MNNLLDKMKNIFNEKAAPFVKEHKRYLGAGALFVCFVVVLIFFAGSEFNSDRIAGLNSIEVSGEEYEPDAEFEVDAYPKVNELVQTYFNAYVNADIATLETVAYPMSEMEQSYITMMSQFYEVYQNVKCYTKHGLSKDSFVVAARFDIKFANVDVVAPSMMLFYVQTNEDGGVYINNLYSDFNMQYSENPISKDVYTALRKVTTQEDYLELYNEVEVAFSKLIKENTDIYQLTKRTIPATRQTWEDTVYYVTSTEGMESTESTEVTETTETTESEETETSENTENTQDDPEPVIQKVRIKADSSVRIRKGPGTSHDKVGDAYNGDEFVKLGVENDENGEEWTKIQFTDSTVAYVKSSFVEIVE